MIRAGRRAVRALLPDHPPLDQAARDRVEADVRTHLDRAIAAAPAHLRLAAVALGAILDLVLLLRPQARARALLEAAQGLGGPAAGLVRLRQSLVVLAFYEHPEVEAHLGVEPPEARQQRFRALREEHRGAVQAPR